MSRNRPTHRNSVHEIALLIETDSSWGRNVIRGIADFARTFGPWNLLLDPGDRGEHVSLPETWRGDGIIRGFRRHCSSNRSSIPIYPRLTSTIFSAIWRVWGRS